MKKNNLLFFYIAGGMVLMIFFLAYLIQVQKIAIKSKAAVTESNPLATQTSLSESDEYSVEFLKSSPVTPTIQQSPEIGSGNVQVLANVQQTDGDYEYRVYKKNGLLYSYHAGNGNRYMTINNVVRGMSNNYDELTNYLAPDGRTVENVMIMPYENGEFNFSASYHYDYPSPEPTDTAEALQFYAKRSNGSLVASVQNISNVARTIKYHINGANLKEKILGPGEQFSPGYVATNFIVFLRAINYVQYEPAVFWIERKDAPYFSKAELKKDKWTIKGANLNLINQISIVSCESDTHCFPGGDSYVINKFDISGDKIKFTFKVPKSDFPVIRVRGESCVRESNEFIVKKK